MTRLLISASAVLLTSCAAAPQASPAQTASQAPTAEPPIAVAGDGDCDSDGLTGYIGQVATDPLREEMRRTSGAKLLRAVPPGTMVTMDFRSDRLTVKLDESNRVLSANCG